MIVADLPPGQLQLWVIIVYLGALIALGLASTRVFRGTAFDYFVASRGVGSVLLVLSVFGTTMTAFAIQGSSGEAWVNGVGVYGKMASWSGLVHAACFFLIGIRLWVLGKRYGYQTQIQFFRDRFDSRHIAVLLFPALTLLQMPYIIIGIIGAGNMISAATAGAFPGLFPAEGPLHGSIPYWLGTLVCTGVVWLYVGLGGVRATAWANALQTVLFLIVGIVTFWMIADRLGGVANITRLVQEYNPTKFTRGVTDEHLRNYEEKLAAWKAATQPAGGHATEEPRPAVPLRPHKPRGISELEFLSYGFIPLSVAMFPHLFQLWLTARSARTFRLTVTLHPVLIMAIWAPCVAIGVWASAALVDGRPVIPFTPESPGANPNLVIGLMVKALGDPFISGLLVAGVLAAILGGMDAQFLSLGSMFTHDIVDHYLRRDRMTDRQRLLTGRLFVFLVVLACWLLALWLKQTRPIFHLAIWCFSGFAALFPLVFGALYWRRMTKWGAYASVIAGLGSGICFYLHAGLQHGFSAPLDPEVWGLVPAAPMVLLATVALVLGSLLSPPPPRDRIQKFFGPHRLGDPEPVPVA